jgi:hypothetical protein
MEWRAAGPNRRRHGKGATRATAREGRERSDDASPLGRYDLRAPKRFCAEPAT